MQNLQVSAQLLNSILGYLKDKPWIEVANLISSIQKEVESQPQPQAKNPE